MTRLRSQPNYFFWILTLITLLLFGGGLSLTWSYSRTWLDRIWHLCQAGIADVGLVWSLVIPLILLSMTLRGSLSLVRQLRATQCLRRAFWPLRQSPPARLRPLLIANRLRPEQIVFLRLPTPQAFCLGLWRPRIWLTSGLIELLSDEELSAVIAHEALHCRRRDPLRLVISRALRSAFFFLPAVGDLAQAAELQQEVAADQAAIAHLGDDLPLLCAIQKLLSRETPGLIPEAAVYSAFNITEARLRCLLAAPKPWEWRSLLRKWGLNLAILTLLGWAALPVQPATIQADEIISCTPEPFQIDQSYTTWVDYNLLNGR